MKKTVIIVLAAIILLVGGFYTLDAYLCSHLYYGIQPFSSCTGGQGKGIDMLGNSQNFWILCLGIASALVPLLYLFLSKRYKLLTLMGLFYVGAVIYIAGVSIMRDALFGQGLLILLFNVAVIFFIFYWTITVLALLGDEIFTLSKRKLNNSIHNVFLKFTLGLIVFCLVNIILLQIHLFYGIVILAECVGLTYLYFRKKETVKEIVTTAENFIYSIHHLFTRDRIAKIFYIGVIIVAVLYIYMGLNLAYIPYPTAWDANHAYIFLPRSWAHNNGLYWGSGGIAGALPYIWYGFLTFWYKFADILPGQGLFGISPDSLTIIMNFWSGPLVLLSSGFALHAFMQYIVGDKIDHKHINNGVLLGVFLMLLWLTSGMGAFLIFIDNKTDLAVMFFTIIAIYTGIQFLHALSHHDGDKKTLRYAVLSGLFFGASAVAKPTGMFDIIHFAMLLLMQWNWLLLGLGGYIFILGGLGLTKLLLVTQFITTLQAYRLMGIGGIIFLIGLWPTIKQKFRMYYLKQFGARALTIIAVIVLFKGPFALIQEILSNGSVRVPQVLRTIILGKNTTTPERIQLASTISTQTLDAVDNATAAPVSVQYISPEQQRMQCLATMGKTDLYSNLKSPGNDGLTEDLGRYVGYGQKTFKNLMLLSWIPDGCYSIYADARTLCSKVAVIQNANKDTLRTTLESVKNSISQKENNKISGWIDSISTSTDDIVVTRIKRDIVTYIQSNTVLVDKNGISIPYKFLVPFNVTFNWSLQNLSSYYTDVGIMLLLGLFLSILGLIYGLLTANKKLSQFSLITLGAWSVWWVVASSIIWYSLGLIVRTIVGTISFIYAIMHQKSQNTLQRNLTYVVICSLIMWGVVQLVLNLFRIASQGAGGPFTWYKSNVGEQYIINDQLLADKTLKIGFNASDVLNLQFPHYKGITEILNQRGKNEGIVIAGTYLQYFIDNQSNIESDGFLAIFRKNISDNNVCNSYLRLKDQKKKYLVIDPNIASVVMGEGNKSLFERFYAVIGEDGKLQQHGTLTMLQALVQQGYLKLVSTNNLITKYAFITPDQQLSALLGINDPEQLLLERAKMTAARFFPKGDVYGNLTLQLFANRLSTYEALADIADIIGKPIRYDVVLEVVKFVEAGVSQQSFNDLQAKITNLTQDEKIVLQQFFSMKKLQKENAQQFRQSLISLVQQSINNGSQLIALSVE